MLLVECNVILCMLRKIVEQINYNLSIFQSESFRFNYMFKLIWFQNITVCKSIKQANMFFTNQNIVLSQYFLIQQ